jgi:hypothetical protein
MELFDEKTEGRKSRDTVPLRGPDSCLKIIYKAFIAHLCDDVSTV